MTFVDKRAILRTGLLGCASILCLAGCSTENRHRVVIYDQLWSSSAGVKNYVCAPELRTSCAQKARSDEGAFAERLAAAFRSSPDCATVQFDLVRGPDERSRDIQRKLEINSHNEYWRLRVDFRPGLSNQPYQLGPGVERARIGGDDAEHTAPFMCKAAKNNGVISVW
jgi:hypothetical protein